MFPFFTLLLILFSFLPVSSHSLSNHNTHRNQQISVLKLRIAPTPARFANAISKFTNNIEKPKYVNNPIGNPSNGQSSNVEDKTLEITNDEPVQVEETIPDNRFYPTPSVHPLPVVTDTPSPTPDEEVYPTLVPYPGPGGCNPCGNGGSKYMCVEIQCTK